MGLRDRIKQAKETLDNADEAEEKPKKQKKGKKEKSKAAAPKQQKQKKGLLNRIGLEREGKQSPEDLAREKRHRIMVDTWIYLRKHIDIGVAQYQDTGDPSMLQKLVDVQLCGQITGQIDQMKAEGIAWSFPERARQSNSNIEVVDEQLDIRTGKPDSFTVKEGFSDFSQFTVPGGNKITADGQFLTLLAHIDMRTESNAKIPVLVKLVQG